MTTPGDVSLDRAGAAAAAGHAVEAALLRVPMGQGAGMLDMGSLGIVLIRGDNAGLLAEVLLRVAQEMLGLSGKPALDCSLPLDPRPRRPADPLEGRTN